MFEEAEEAEEAEETEELIVVYNGTEYQILNAEMIAKIKELLEIE